MLSRGSIIGKLIDDLTLLETRLKFRGQLGFFDLNRISEDFIKEVLNICYDYRLTNLNATHLNTPGLDLGDPGNGVAFQVTSTNTPQKINNTLLKIKKAQLAVYPRICIIILGRKLPAAKYKLNLTQVQRCGFQLTNIFDFQDISQHIVALPTEKLIELHELFTKEFMRVVLEFELPNNNGVYPTSLLDKLEISPTTICQTAAKFLADHPGDGYQLDLIQASFNKLAKLARVTREFLLVLVSEGSPTPRLNFQLTFPELKRKLHVPPAEIKEELDILVSHRLVQPVDDDVITTKFDETLFGVVEWAKKSGLLSKVFVALDFTQLD